MGESELIRGAVAGDRSSFDRLCEPHRQDLYLFCFRFLRNADDSQDLVQEILSRAWRNLDTFRSESSFRTWLWEIGRNLCLNHLRSRKSLLNRRTIHIEDSAAGEEIVDHAPSPDSQVLAGADLKEIQLRVVQLAKQKNWLQTDWELFTFRIQQDISYADFASKRGHDEAYWRNRWRDKIKPVFDQIQKERTKGPEI